MIANEYNHRIPQVLVIHSYHAGYKWSDDISKGFITKLREHNPKIRIVTEYLDTKRFFNEEYTAKQKERLAFKYSDERYDVIIAVDNNAFDIVLDIRKDVFYNTPLVFCGVNNFNSKQIASESNITGVNESASISETLELIGNLHPETKNILFINDNTATGAQTKGYFKNQMRSFDSSIKVEYFNDTSIEGLVQRVRNLDSSTVVLYATFFKDNKGTFIGYDESIMKVVDASSVPVYVVWDFSLGYGAIGGFLTSGLYQGEAAAELTHKILSGEPADQIEIVTESPNKFIFDKKALDKWGISENQLPKGAHIINKEESFYAKNRILIWKFIIVIIVLGLIILALIFTVMKKVLLERKLKISHADLLDAKNNLKTIVAERTEELTIERNFFSTVLENEDAFVIVFDKKGDISRINKYACNKLELTSDNCEATDFWKHLKYPDKVTYLRENLFTETFLSSSRQLLLNIVSERGTELLLETVFTGIYSPNLEYVVLTGVDITEKVKIVKELERNELKYRLLFENNGIALVSIDETGLITMANKELLDMLGYSKEEVVGLQRWNDFIHEASMEKITQNRKKRFNNEPGVKDNYEIKMITKEGFVKDALINIVLIRETREIIASFIDISKSKVIERKMLQSINEGKASNKVKASFLSNMGTRIANPLDSINAVSELLYGTGLDAKQRSLVDTVRHNSLFLFSYINQVSDYSKLKDEKIEVIYETISLKMVVDQVLNEFSYQARRKGIELLCIIEENTPAQIRGDLSNIYKVIRNLLYNALEFTVYGSIKLMISNSVHGQFNEVSFKIDYSGAGLDQRVIRALKSNSEEQISMLKQNLYDTLSIGLLVSKKLVKLMGGVLDVESFNGGNTIFTFTITTQVLENNKPGEWNQILHSETSEDMGSTLLEDKFKLSSEVGTEIGGKYPLNILLASQDKTYSDVLTRLLISFGYDIQVTFGENNILDLFETQTFDLVLLDVKNQKLDGYETAKRIRELGTNISQPYLVDLISDLSSRILLSESTNLNDYLLKPFVANKLMKVIVDSWQNKIDK